MLIAGIVCKRSPSPIRGLPVRYIGDSPTGRLIARQRESGWELRFLDRQGPRLFAMTARAVIEAKTLREAEALLLSALEPAA